VKKKNILTSLGTIASSIPENEENDEGDNTQYPRLRKNIFSWPLWKQRVAEGEGGLGATQGKGSEASGRGLRRIPEIRGPPKAKTR